MKVVVERKVKSATIELETEEECRCMEEIAQKICGQGTKSQGAHALAVAILAEIRLDPEPVPGPYYANDNQPRIIKNMLPKARE